MSHVLYFSFHQTTLTKDELQPGQLPGRIYPPCMCPLFYGRTFYECTVNILFSRRALSV